MVLPKVPKDKKLKSKHDAFMQDMEFVIEPRYKSDVESSEDEHPESAEMDQH